MKRIETGHDALLWKVFPGHSWKLWLYLSLGWDHLAYIARNGKGELTRVYHEHILVFKMSSTLPAAGAWYFVAPH